ncbi:MAG: DUF3048 domain-containing protein [Chloroflexi bacterium]|nr:DUF3048 domain-containing protein [Chloroflexota bacterium]
MPMNFCSRRFTPLGLLSWILTFSLISSCASSPNLTPAAVSLSVIATLTPFQPQPGLTIDPNLNPQIGPTFTPYPTRYIPPQGISTPVAVLPQTDGSLLNINNPLTGLPVSDAAFLQRRPLAIKIANAPDYVRPQSGLTLADVIYEYYIEWGDTRFIAVFYSNNPAMVGPVRSGRYFDEHVTRMYHAFLVFKSADPRELSYLQGSDLKDFLVIVGFGGCSPYFTGPYHRDSYNNQFFNSTKWADCAEKKGVDNSPQALSGGFFAEDVPESTQKASRIFSYYSEYNYNFWEYDPATHQYFRYQESQDMVNGKAEAYALLSDAQTGLPVTAANVVTLFVPHIYANTFNAHDQVFNIDLIDFGNAYVFRDGSAIPAMWQRVHEDQPLLLTTLEGEPIYLRPGRTAFQVLGVNSTHTQSGEDWRFVFQTP